MKRSKLCSAVLSMLAIAAGAAWGAGALLPYATGFESGIHSNDLTAPWTNVVGFARYDNLGSTPDQSTNTANISDDVALEIASGGSVYSNVWWQGYAKATLQTADTAEIGDNVAAFFVKTNGIIRAYSNNVWVTIGTILPAPAASDWLGFSVHLDYVTRAYDVYRLPSGQPYGTPMEKVNTGALGFNTNGTANTHTQFTQFRVEGTTYLEAIELSAASVADLVDENSPSNSVNTSESVYLKPGFSGVLVKYFDPLTPERSMGGKLGAALYGALVEFDKVFIRNPSGGWYELTHNGPGNTWSPTNLLDSIVVGGGEAIYIQFNGTETRVPATLSGKSGIYRAVGRDIETESFNLLAVPMDATRNFNISGGATPMGLPTPEPGDRMYILPLTGTGYTYLMCRGVGVWTDVTTGLNANVSLVPGQALWYYRAGITENWDVNNATFGVYED